MLINCTDTPHPREGHASTWQIDTNQMFRSGWQPAPEPTTERTYSVNILSRDTSWCSLVQDRRPYFDVVCLHASRGLRQYEMDTLEALCGRRPALIRFKPDHWLPTTRCDGRVVPLRFTLCVWQPSIDAIRFLCEREKHSGLHVEVSLIEISLDFLTRSQSGAERVHTALAAHLAKPGKGRAKNVEVITSSRGTTHYFGSRYGRPGHIKLYSGLPSKVSGGPCAHIEARMVGRRAVRAAGIESLTSLLTFDHPEFWRAKLRLYSLDLDALGKRLDHKHLNCRSEIHQCGSFSYNVDRQRAAIYLQAQRINYGVEHDLTLVDALRMLAENGIAAPRRLLEPMNATPLMPISKGMPYAPSARRE